MGFFVGRPRFASSDPAAVAPEWFQPPVGVLPGFVDTRAVLIRSERHLLVVDELRAYPNGLSFTLSLTIRDSNDALLDLPWERHHPDDATGVMTFGVELSDGSTWTTLDAMSTQSHDNAPSVWVMPRGGGGAGQDWSMGYWMWPLPPAGDVTFVVAWDAMNVPETRAVIDGNLLIRAVSRAETVWTG